MKIVGWVFVAPGRVRADVADVDVPDESAGRGAADPGENVERGDLAEVRRCDGGVDGVADLSWLSDAPRLKSRKPERTPIGRWMCSRSVSRPLTSSRWVLIHPVREEANSRNLNCGEQAPP
jgi:hypothetical protein